MKDILLNIESKETRLALLKFGVLWDLVIERSSSKPLTGNIYRGSVTNILHNIQSAFIDIDEGDNGFIHISDILENAQKLQEMYGMDLEWDEENKPPQKRIQTADIDQLLNIDQPVLVQVVKEPIGSKGARLTSNISVAGRYLVMLPNNPHRGVSRKIEDRGAREKLKKIIRSFEMPKDTGLICRTSSVNASPEKLADEARDLFQTWETIVEEYNKATGPKCLFEESDLIKRAVLTAVDKKYDRILVDDQATFLRCKKLYAPYANEHPIKIEMYRDKIPMFERFGVERELDKAMKRKIWLPSGGYLFFDLTEAMCTIDVNSGRSSGDKAKDLEEGLARINMEAAEEIARQLRLRNIGGLVICDFIDMRSRKNQRRVLDRLKEALKEDSAKCTVLGMSEFGLVEMTRQRSRESLYQTILSHCPYCSGLGSIKTHESVEIEIERALKKLINLKEEYALEVNIHPQVSQHMGKKGRDHLIRLAKTLNADIKFKVKDALHLNDFEFYC
ncbi:MAG TPA: Rne/Rng family ribonuclease, partial [Chlamydiales bacterium]|nr:Rne/Rng family ribonuclease [Chlamydiales bacterium]